MSNERSCVWMSLFLHMCIFGDRFWFVEFVMMFSDSYWCAVCLMEINESWCFVRSVFSLHAFVMIFNECGDFLKSLSWSLAIWLIIVICAVLAHHVSYDLCWFEGVFNRLWVVRILFYSLVVCVLLGWCNEPCIFFIVFGDFEYIGIGYVILNDLWHKLNIEWHILRLPIDDVFCYIVVIQIVSHDIWYAVFI